MCGEVWQGRGEGMLEEMGMGGCGGDWQSRGWRRRLTRCWCRRCDGDGDGDGGGGGGVTSGGRLSAAWKDGWAVCQHAPRDNRCCV
jgi:hypothetical protein